MDVVRRRLGMADNNRNENSSQTPQHSNSSSSEGRLNSNKLLSTWYNMKYGKALFSLDSNTYFNVNSPVWLLGVCYHRRMRQTLRTVNQEQSVREIESGTSAFYDDINSRIWFTYRKNIEEFGGTRMSSDVGWGCMIRSGQMMLANALIQLKLGRHWNWNGPTRSIYIAEDLCDELVHRNIIQIFGDFYNEDISPLSIQNIMTTAKESMNSKPGDWFGPTTVSHLLKKTFDKYRNNHSVLKSWKIYVAKDSTVYKGDIYNMCRIKQNAKACPSYDSLINLDEYSIIDPSELQNYNMPTTPTTSPQFDLYNQGSENISTTTNELSTNNSPYIISDCDHIHVENEENMSIPPSSLYHHNFRKFRRRSQSCPSISKAGWTPVLILIPVKIGRDQKINPIYGQCLKSFLATDTCVGIIGGKPKHSLYFVGFQDDNLIHLDPHLVQDGVDIFKEDFDLQTYHSKTPRKLPLNKMDPSCCIGFLIETEHQFDGWCQMSAELAAPTSKSGHRYPMFSIIEGQNVPNVSEVLNDAYQLDSIDEAGLDATLTIPHNPHEEDEFVFL